ncbi:peroxisome membrane protein [Usnea florida]
MTSDQSNGSPIPSDATPKPITTSTPSITARLRIPNTYTTLPCQWLSTYRSFVRHNASQVTSLESALRSLTYLLPGTRFADHPLTSESLHTVLALLTAYNTHLLASPPSFSPLRRYEHFWESQNSLYARCSALLRLVQYTQLLLEMLAKRAGESARWRLVVVLEVVKALCRLCMVRFSGSRPVIATGVGDNDRSERTSPPPSSSADDGTTTTTFSGDALKEGEWKMPRTGMRLPRRLPSSSSPTTGPAPLIPGNSRESITDFLTSRVITADEIKPAPQLVRSLHSLPAQVSELLYILRPVLYALALQHYKANRKDWRPWLLGFGMEMAARQVGRADVRGRVDGNLGQKRSRTE